LGALSGGKEVSVASGSSGDYTRKRKASQLSKDMTRRLREGRWPQQGHRKVGVKTYVY